MVKDVRFISDQSDSRKIHHGPIIKSHNGGLDVIAVISAVPTTTSFNFVVSRKEEVSGGSIAVIVVLGGLLILIGNKNSSNRTTKEIWLVVWISKNGVGVFANHFENFVIFIFLVTTDTELRERI